MEGVFFSINKSMVRAEDKNLQPATEYNFLDTLVSLFIYATGFPHLLFWTGVFSIIGRLFPGEKYDPLTHWVARLLSKHAGFKVKVIGKEKIKKGVPYIFVVNHVNAFDLFTVYGALPVYCRSFEDISHFKIPIYGHLIKVVGQVPVSREDKEITRKAYEKAKEMLSKGHSFVVFPEGHRTRDGSLGHFYSGAFRLAIETQTQIVPVVQRGARRVARKGDWRIRPGVVEVVFGDPIPTSGLTLNEVEVLKERVRQIMAEMLVGDEA